MPAVEEIVETEQERVERWRADELDAGRVRPRVGRRSSPRAPTSTSTAPPSSSIAAARPSSHCRSCSSRRNAAEWRAVSAVLASIPSPPTGVYHVGPLHAPHVRRDAAARDRGGACGSPAAAGCSFGGDWDLVYRVTIWGVDRRDRRRAALPRRHELEPGPAIHDHWYGPFAVWQGGLGIWGGILFGVLAGAWVVRRSGNSVAALHGRRRARRCCSRRRSAAGATGGTRSSTAATRRCRGRSRSTARRPATPRTTRPSSTSSSGTSSACSLLLWIDRRFRHPAAGALRALRRVLHVRPHVRGDCCAPTRRTTSSGMRAELLGLARRLRRRAPSFFLWWQFLRDPDAPGAARAAAAARRPAKPEPKRNGPQMAVPKGRVR